MHSVVLVLIKVNHKTNDFWPSDSQFLIPTPVPQANSDQRQFCSPKTCLMPLVQIIDIHQPRHFVIIHRRGPAPPSAETYFRWWVYSIPPHLEKVKLHN